MLAACLGFSEKGGLKKLKQLPRPSIDNTPGFWPDHRGHFVSDAESFRHSVIPAL